LALLVVTALVFAARNVLARPVTGRPVTARVDQRCVAPADIVERGASDLPENDFLR